MKNLSLRLISLALSLVMILLAFVGCDKGKDNNEGKNTEPPSENTTVSDNTEATIKTTSVKLSEITIVHAEDEVSTAAAQMLKELIAEKAKVTLRVTDKYEESDSYKIIIGNFELDITNEFFAKDEDDTFKIYDLVISGNRIALAASNRLTAESACADFVELFVKADSDSIEIADEMSYEGNLYGHAEVFIEERIDETDIRIATFNVANYMDLSKRLKSFSKLFNLFDADVIMLQEMNSDFNVRLGFTLRRLGYLQAPIANSGNNNSSDPNPIYYRKDRLQLVSSHHQVFTDREKDTRAFTIAEFTDTVTGKTFSCISTHASTDSQTRINHAEELKGFITEYQSTRTTPLFLLGDLNSTKARPPLSTVIASFMTHATDMTGIVKRNMEYGTSAAGSGHTWPAKDRHIIDHAYGLGAGYSGKQYQIVASQLAADTSDHLPVLFDFALN